MLPSLLIQPGCYGGVVDHVVTISLFPFYHATRKTVSGLDFHLPLEEKRWEKITHWTCVVVPQM